MLRKRAIFETVNDEFENRYQIEHTSYNSIENFFTNFTSGNQLLLLA